MIFKPDIKLDRVTDITLALLEKYKIKALILDVDNTLSTHHGDILTDGLTEWLALMQDNGISLTVLSNSKEERVKPFAEKIGLQFVSLACKPLPFGYLRAIKSLKIKRKEAAIVGDQIFTDIIGGNFIGLNTVLLTPIKPEDGWSFKLRRRIERFLIKSLKITNTEV